LLQRFGIKESDPEESKGESKTMRTTVDKNIAAMNEEIKQRGKSFTHFSKDQLTERSQFLLQEFQFLKLIGRGAQGAVFLAVRTTTGERFAAKVILKRETVEKSQLEEAILGIVKEHPFIVTLEHVFENDRRIYFFMRYVEGHDLKGHLEKQKLFAD